MNGQLCVLQRKEEREGGRLSERPTLCTATYGGKGGGRFSERPNFVGCNARGKGRGAALS